MNTASLLGVTRFAVTRFAGRLVSASRANVGDFLADVCDAFKRSIERRSRATSFRESLLSGRGGNRDETVPPLFLPLDGCPVSKSSSLKNNLKVREDRRRPIGRSDDATKKSQIQLCTCRKYRDALVAHFVPLTISRDVVLLFSLFL